MNRQRSLLLLVSGLLAFFSAGGVSDAGEPGCCAYCGHQLVCQVMCEIKTVSVLRYKVDAQQCPPPKDCCCDDRWILGCCKPIKIISIVPQEELKSYPVRRYVVHKCPYCEPGSVSCGPMVLTK
jgi:hypothetical protein